MTIVRLFGGLALLLLAATFDQADILPPDRDASANWRMAGMLSVGGIPTRTTECGARISPRGGGLDDTANIQSAISACPLDQVVRLTIGTFTISEGSYILVNRGITLRGAGAGKTILQRTGGAVMDQELPGSNPSPMIIVGPMRWGNNFVSTGLTADVAAGGSSVTVQSTAGFSVGQIVLLDEKSGASYQTDPQGRGQIWAAPDFRVVWQKHNPHLGYDDFGASSTPSTPGSAGEWFSRLDRPTAEYHRIASISGNAIDFDSPATISYRTSHQAQLSYTQTPYVTNAGVENMTLMNGDNGQLRFQWAAMSWADSVENTVWHDEGFAIDHSFRIQLEKFYVHDGAWSQPGGAGYAISLSGGSSEILIQNGISVRANKVMVSRCSGAGSVVAYNYMDDGFINTIGGWIEVGINNSHMTGSHHMLLEGNQSFNMDSDDTHGAAIYSTYFRNYAAGPRTSFTNPHGGQTIDDVAQSNGPWRAAGAQAYSYWFSFIGNVLGAPGSAGWVYSASNWINGQHTIWQLGWDSFSPYPVDAQVAATAIRDGNFDAATNSVVWATGPYTLPKSLYLPRKPSFFNAGAAVYTWPWVNPTGTPQLFTLPAKARYDAGTPFIQP